MNYVFIFCSVFLKVTENERYPTSCLLTTDFLFSILVFLFLFLYSDLLILCILVLQIHLSVLLCETEMRDQYAKLFWFSMLRCKLYFFLMMLNIWLHRQVVLVICCFYKKVVWKWCHPRYLKRHFCLLKYLKYCDELFSAELESVFFRTSSYHEEVINVSKSHFYMFRYNFIFTHTAIVPSGYHHYSFMATRTLWTSNELLIIYCMSYAQEMSWNHCSDSQRSTLFYDYLYHGCFFRLIFFHTHLQFTVQMGKEVVIFIPLYHFQPLTNIKAILCNVSSWMTTTDFSSQQ